MIHLAIFVLWVNKDYNLFFYSFFSIDDATTLQKATVELEIAKTISLCIKADYKRRNVLLKNKNAQEQTKQVNMYRMIYTLMCSHFKVGG